MDGWKKMNFPFGAILAHFQGQTLFLVSGRVLHFNNLSIVSKFQESWRIWWSVSVFFRWITGEEFLLQRNQIGNSRFLTTFVLLIKHEKLGDTKNYKKWHTRKWFIFVYGKKERLGFSAFYYIKSLVHHGPCVYPESQQVELAAPFDTKVLECGLTAGCVLTAVSWWMVHGPLKMGQNCPKRKVHRIPTIHFQARAVSFRAGRKKQKRRSFWVEENRNCILVLFFGGSFLDITGLGA